MRINQYIAAAGITSRRKADEMIEEGRVRVNGIVLKNPGYHVEDGDIVEVDGRRIEPEQKKVYYLLNKPTGYVTSTSDKEGRPVVTELVPDSVRVFPVGRLDLNTCAGAMRRWTARSLWRNAWRTAGITRIWAEATAGFGNA